MRAATVVQVLQDLFYVLFNSRLDAHAQKHVKIQLKTMKIEKEYSANGLELVKERTSPMPTQR